MNSSCLRLSVARVLLLTPLVAVALAADKSAYSFINPTPDALLREMSTDRPDSTESPFTVDAGRVQIEMDMVNFTHDRSGGDRTREWGLAPFNLRLGLRHNFEVGVFVAPFIHVTEEPAGGPKTTMRGIGDTTLRAKFNFWGNDDGPTALGPPRADWATTSSRARSRCRSRSSWAEGGRARR